MLSRRSVGIHLGNELTCNTSRNTCPQSSQLAEPLWTDPWPMSESGACQMILTFFFKNMQAGDDSFHLPL